ncbi:hypothetical protein Mfer_0453 [Methanothermus fervidus DSM 2088]|uniref:Uncharacterized protein n=1 Tax=Methanothermus fervidus (strain ATCC 43054 / DSM 2088 / JCM 10308 / V24 S) TaxID=523846 RepID=E3GY71_METFV|nr:hypothetical protein Mfer_0453 [Methanothermus fervidus DSM 2088]
MEEKIKTKDVAIIITIGILGNLLILLFLSAIMCGLGLQP